MATTAAAMSRRCVGAFALRCRSLVFPSARLARCHLQPQQCPPIDVCCLNIRQLDSLQRFYSGSRNTPPPVQGREKSDLEEEEDDDIDAEESDSDGEEEGSSDDEECLSSKRIGYSGKTDAEKTEEASGIGYKVVGPLDPTERPFKPYEPVFAVVQIGSHQFKISNGDSIFTERLKYCEVNDKLILSKVLMLGSATQTIIGRPTLPDVSVHAIVEEHALDAKVIIFKKKRRKNYRRTKGHRQELTKLRITDVQGIDKPVSVAVAA